MIISILFGLLMFFFIALLYFLRFKSQENTLSIRIILGLIFGVLYGFILKMQGAHQLSFIQDVLLLIGQGYLGLLKMLVVPLVLTSIIHAVLNVGQDGNFPLQKGQFPHLKQLSLWICFLLLGMTAISALIGIFAGLIFHAGEGLKAVNFDVSSLRTPVPLVETLLKMLPANPVAAMAQENSIAVVLFALLIGIAARMSDKIEHDKIKIFSQFVSAAFFIVKQLTKLVLAFTPYGIFSLISLLIFLQGTALLSGLLNFIVAMYAAMLAVMVMHSLILFFTTGCSPFKYFKNAYLPLFVAFITRSSFATLPVTEETLRNKFRVQQVTSTLAPSIGATIGMNACAGIFPAMLVVMTLTMAHQTLTWPLMLSVMFINAIASLGISGIPGTAFVAASVALTSLNLPLTVLGLVQGIDPIVDMGRTAVNVNGVMTTALASERLTAYND